MEMNTLQDSINKRAKLQMEKDWKEIEQQIGVFNFIKMDFFIEINEKYFRQENYQVIQRMKEAFFRDRLKSYIESETQKFLKSFEDLKEKSQELENQYLALGN
jgi:hypothetical protein